VTKTNGFILAVLLSAIGGRSHAEEGPKVIAEGDWSKPVADAVGKPLRPATGRGFLDLWWRDLNTRSLFPAARSGTRCRTRSGNLFIACNLAAKIAPLEIKRHIDQTDHHGNLDQRTDDGGEGNAGIDSEDGDCNGNRQLEVVARSRECNRGRFVR
jgi:hypothetical protein